MSKQKVLIVGARGFIGGAIYKAALADFEVLGTSTKPVKHLIEFNLCTPDEFDFSHIDPATTVILTAAESSPDKCSSQFDRVWDINVEGTSTFIETVLKRRGKVAFFSSDTVYGEQSEFFDEDQPIAPMGPYAKMKAMVEDRFKNEHNFKSLRLSYVFSKQDKYTTYLVNCAKSGVEAEVFHPFFRSVVHLNDVVSGVLSLIKNWDLHKQIFINFGGPETISRLDFATVFSESPLPTLRYRIYEPDSAFFKNRPQIIKMRSPLLVNLIGRMPCKFREAVHLEFNCGEND